jgi:hypothetical protein
MLQTSCLFSTLLLLFCCARIEGQTPPWLANNPAHFHQSMMADGGLEIESKYDRSVKNWVISHVTNNEVWYAMQLLFYGKQNGIAMELGALSGTMVTRCETEELEKFYWQRIVVEANPTYRGSLAALQQAFAVSAAICKSNQMLHYVMNTADPYVNGIAEFMHPNFIRKFHPQVTEYSSISKNNSFMWPATLPPFVVEIPCISMSSVLKASGITHINLWLLDTEGAELSILQTVDWTSVVFDVIIVETEPKNRSKQYALEVKIYLEARGYVLLAIKRGRNSWYRHKSFVTATRAPKLDKYMNFLSNVVYATATN